MRISGLFWIRYLFSLGLQPQKVDIDNPALAFTMATSSSGSSSTMEKYRLVEEYRGQGDDFLEEESSSEEVRITHLGKPKNYISYAMSLFADGETTIVLKAMGKAINKTVTIAEILKRKLPLHQITSLTSVEMIDVFEPLEEGLDVVKNHRHVSCVKITLSLKTLDSDDIGYQPPLPLEELQPGDAALRQSEVMT